jgi:hypothetical protein
VIAFARLDTGATQRPVVIETPDGRRWVVALVNESKDGVLFLASVVVPSPSAEHYAQMCRQTGVAA